MNTRDRLHMQVPDLLEGADHADLLAAETVPAAFITDQASEAADVNPSATDQAQVSLNVGSSEQDVFNQFTSDNKYDKEAPATDGIRLYLNRIGKYALLNAEEEIDLAKRIETGLYADHLLLDESLPHKRQRDLRLVSRDGAQAMEHLVNANLRLAVNIATHYRRGALTLDDRIQAGNGGLIRAAQSFDYTKGFKFSTYATWWMRQRISYEANMQAGVVRIPPVFLAQHSAFIKATDELQLDPFDPNPDLAAIAKQMGVTVERAKDIYISLKDPISVNEKTNADKDTEFGDFIVDTDEISVEEDLVHRTQLEGLEEALSELDNQEGVDMVRRSYGIGGRPVQSQAEIGKVYGVSATTVSKRIRLVLAQLAQDPRLIEPSEET